MVPPPSEKRGTRCSTDKTSVAHFKRTPESDGEGGVRISQEWAAEIAGLDRTNFRLARSPLSVNGTSCQWAVAGDSRDYAFSVLAARWKTGRGLQTVFRRHGCVA